MTGLCGGMREQRNCDEVVRDVNLEDDFFPLIPLHAVMKGWKWFLEESTNKKRNRLNFHDFSIVIVFPYFHSLVGAMVVHWYVASPRSLVDMSWAAVDLLSEDLLRKPRQRHPPTTPLRFHSTLESADMEKVIFIWIFLSFFSCISHPLLAITISLNFLFHSAFHCIQHGLMIVFLAIASPPTPPASWQHSSILWSHLFSIFFSHSFLSPSSLWRCLETKLKFPRHRLASCHRWASQFTARRVTPPRWWMRIRCTTTSMETATSPTSDRFRSGYACSSSSATSSVAPSCSRRGKSGNSSMPLTSASLLSPQSVSYRDAGREKFRCSPLVVHFLDNAALGIF